MSSLIPDDAELILHIGAPKTGTSAVQRHFHAQAEVLRRHGLHYPRHGLDANGVSGGHADLVALVLGAGPAAGRRALVRHLADARRAGCRLLLSAESTFLHPAAIVAALPTPRFHVVALARHPLDAVVSHHNQGVKRHRTRRPLRRLAAAIVAAHEPLRSLSGEPLLEWRDRCGRERVTVLPYVVAGETVDATALLRAVVGLPTMARPRPVNTSYPPAALELKRLVNLVPAELLGNLDEALDLRLQAFADARGRPAPTLDDLLDADSCAALEGVFQPAVARVEAAFGIRLGRRAPVATSPGTPADAWSELALERPLAEQLRAAVAAALAAGATAPGLHELARIIAPDGSGDTDPPPHRLPPTM